jgi:hypothetical protein
MSAICPVYPKQQTFQDPVGTSYLGHEPTSAFLMFANPAVTTALSLSNTLAGVAPTTRRPSSQRNAQER